MFTLLPFAHFFLLLLKSSNVFIQIVVLSPHVLCALAMRPAAVGQCNTVPAPHGDIYSASSFLRNLNFFPALTFGAILPATPQLLPGVPSSSTLCHFLRAPAACIPRRCTATPLPMQLLPLILAYKLLTDPFSSLLLILHFQLSTPLLSLIFRLAQDSPMERRRFSCQKC